MSGRPSGIRTAHERMARRPPLGVSHPERYAADPVCFVIRTAPIPSYFIAQPRSIRPLKGAGDRGLEGRFLGRLFEGANSTG